jgi:hypothetical protein
MQSAAACAKRRRPISFFQIIEFQADQAVERSRAEDGKRSGNAGLGMACDVSRLADAEVYEDVGE